MRISDYLDVPERPDLAKFIVRLGDVRRWVSPDEHGELRPLGQLPGSQTVCPCPLVARWPAGSRTQFAVKRLEPPAAGKGGVAIEQEAALLPSRGLASVAGASWTSSPACSPSPPSASPPSSTPSAA